MTFKEENIVNISMRAAELLKDHKIQPDDISGHAALTAEIIAQAEEFEQMHAHTDWNASDAPDYWESIDSFAEDRLLARYGIEREENSVSLWARVGMTLNVPKETYERLLTGDRVALQAVLDGEVGEARLDGETYFPDTELNVGLEDMEFDLPVSTSTQPTPAASNEAIYDLVCVLAVSAGGVKKLLYSGAWEECNDFCEEHNWTFIDENSFQWELELEDTRELPPHLRPAVGHLRRTDSPKSTLDQQIQSAAQRSAGPSGSFIALTPNPDRTWSAGMTQDISASQAIPFVAEGSYPAELIYRRTDINGSGVFESETCKTRDELLQVLNWMGKCGFVPLELWNYDIEQANDTALLSVFQQGELRRFDLLSKEHDEMMEGEMRPAADSRSAHPQREPER